MTDLLIRDLDPDVHRELTRRAALARALDARLVTTDQKLARAVPDLALP